MRMTQQRPGENGGGGAREAERSKPSKCGHSLRPSERVKGRLRTLASGKYAAREPTTSWPVVVLGRRQRCFEASSRSPGRFSAGGRGRNQQARQQHICAPHMTASACAPGAVVAVRTMCAMTVTLRHSPRNNASLPSVSSWERPIAGSLPNRYRRAVESTA